MAVKKIDKYLNNNESLPINITVDYTPEQFIEMKKCMEDVNYFAENYFYIVNLDEGRQTIKIFDAQRKAIDKIIKEKRTIICASRQIGKALGLDTHIPTPNGWTTMGELKIGQQVYDDRGNICNVTHVHDIMYNRECFKVKFSNGDEIVADAEHDWMTQIVESDELVSIKRSTSYIRDTLKTSTGSPNHRIKMSKMSDIDYVYIDDIEKIDSIPVRCITVDSVNHMYLCGKTMIPTSNTTLMTIVCLWNVLFKKDYQVAILANKEDQAKEILERIKLAYEELPNWLKTGVSEFTKEVLKLVNGSKIFVSTTSESGIRGKSVNLLFVDEFAHIQSQIADPFFKSVMPTISSSKSAKIVLISCVTEDTYIFSSKGIRQIKDYRKKECLQGYEIDEYSILGKTDMNTGTTFFNSGVSDVYEIDTSWTKLKGAPTHKLFACKDGKYDWYTIDQLQAGDYVAIQYGNNIWGDNDSTANFTPMVNKKIKNKFDAKQITPDLSYLIGIYLSEGSVYKKYTSKGNWVGASMFLTCGDSLIPILDKLNIKYYLAEDNLHYTVSSKNLIEFFEFIGFDLYRKSPKKIIPSRLLEMSRPNIIALLQGIFDGDGSAIRDGRVTISLSSPIFIEQLRMILLNFGILCEWSTGVTPPTKKCKVESTYYRLSMCGCNAQKYYKEIGFRFERKQNILEINYKDKPDIINPLDNIPHMCGIFKPDFRKVKKKFLTKGLVNAFYEDKNISRDKLLDFKNKYGFSSDLLNEIVSPNIRWQKIKDKTYIGKQEVYDFSLPNKEDSDPYDWNHSVIYNGILGHQTPKGAEGKFYEIFRDAEKKKNGWCPVRIHYSEVPGRDAAWVKEQQAAINYDMDAWRQEFEIEFLENGTAALNQAVIDRMKSEACPAEFSFDDGDYFVWKNPEPNRIITIGVDVAEGVGQDFTIAIVLDITDLNNIEQCAIFASNKMQPWVFAEKLNQIARSWGRPFLCIERNKEGGQVVDAIMNVHNYDNVVTYSMKNDKRGVYQSPGIFCHQNSKYTGIQNMKYFIENRQSVKLYDINTIREFETFIRKVNRTWGAKKGFNDDRIMALVWALVILEKDMAEKYLDVIEYDEAGKPSVIIDPNQHLSNMEYDGLIAENKPIREIGAGKDFNAFFNPFTSRQIEIPEKYHSMMTEEMWEFIK
jgi:hypothetical protein